MVHGTLSGLIYIVVLYAISSIEKGFLLSSTSFVMALISIIMGAIGGIVGVNIR